MKFLLIGMMLSNREEKGSEAGLETSEFRLQFVFWFLFRSSLAQLIKKNSSNSYKPHCYGLVNKQSSQT